LDDWHTLVTLTILLALILLPGGARGGESAAVLAEADELVARIDYGGAEEALLRSLKDYPEVAGLQWRLARVHVLSAEVASGDAFRRHLVAGENHARQAIALDSTVAEGFTWLAAALGYRALISSTAEQLALLKEILEATDRAIRLNPDDDIAYSIRGSTFRALGNVGWFQRGVADLLLGGVPEGGFAEAEACLEEAVRLAPGIMRHRYELAVLLLDRGREDEARRMLKEAAGFPVRIASDVPRLETIRELLTMEHPSSPPPVTGGTIE